MIVIQHSGGMVYQMEFKEGETFSQLATRFKDELGVHFAGNSGFFQDTSDGRVISESELVLDERRYSLIAWLEKAAAA